MKDANGHLVQSDILPQMKQALGVLRDWYSAGVIPVDFFTVDDSNDTTPRPGITLSTLGTNPGDFPDSAWDSGTALWGQVLGLGLVRAARAQDADELAVVSAPQLRSSRRLPGQDALDEGKILFMTRRGFDGHKGKKG